MEGLNMHFILESTCPVAIYNILNLADYGSHLTMLIKMQIPLSHALIHLVLTESIIFPICHSPHSSLLFSPSPTHSSKVFSSSCRCFTFISLLSGSWNQVHNQMEICHMNSRCDEEVVFCRNILWVDSVRNLSKEVTIITPAIYLPSNCSVQGTVLGTYWEVWWVCI